MSEIETDGGGVGEEEEEKEKEEAESSLKEIALSAVMASGDDRRPAPEPVDEELCARFSSDPFITALLKHRETVKQMQRTTSEDSVLKIKPR